MDWIGKLMDCIWNLTFEKAKKWYYLVDNLRSLETKLQRLRNRKIDFESKVKVAERSGTKKRKREVENWFDEVAKIENEFVALKTSIQEGGFLENAISSGKRVEKMDEIVEQLMVQSDSDHFGELCLEASESRGEPREITELFGEMFRKGVETITAWLGTNEILRIGIWGMGGVGKTTLADHIHDHLLKNTQSKVYWISVSQDFTVKRLQGDVAKRLRLDLSDVDDEKVRARRLRDAFDKMEEMVVLMLDDVWEYFCLDILGIDARNCRLILTTRSLQVCNQMRCHPFELKTLDTEEAWGLFERTLGSETVLDGDLERIAKSITERCGGLPLGIVVMAGSMIGVTDIHEWRNALEDLKAGGNDEMEEKVFRILEWSFNRLNKCEKNCFLYCCLYPEDSDIKRKELIDLFIGAELMQERNSWSQEFDQGHAILNKLIRVCLLEKTTDYTGDDCVKMHDLVRDMAIRITHGNSKPESSRDDVPRFLVKSLGQEDSQATTLEREEWTQDLRAVSFYSQDSKEIEIPPAWSPNCPKLSTLLLSDIFIEEIPDSFFRHMCGLKVLNLYWCKGITELPHSVSDLVNLTALILGGCGDLRSVPPLGKLKQLRDLDLSETKIEDLPEGLESLVNLQRLNLDECGAFSQKIIPKGTFSQLHRLQLLLLPPYPRVQVNDPEVLNQLESFEGCLSFTDFYKITRWPKYYTVYVNDRLTEDPFYFDDYEDQEKQLHFHQCELGRGSNYLPDDMKRLIIQDCEGMGIRSLSDVFRNFINLSHLSELEITDVVGIEFLWQLSSASPRDPLEVSSISPFCGLERLRLSKLPNLVGLFYGESEPYLLPAGTFSSLQILEISDCDNMKQLFTVQLLQNLQNLEELTVRDCEGLEEIVADGNGVGQGGGEGTQLTSSEGATATVILPKLRRLRLDNLPQLKNICKAAMIYKSIEKITIFNCPNLKRLPLFLSAIDGPPYLLPAGTFSSLKELTIFECHDMKQLFTVQLLQNLQNLEELTVKHCEGPEEIAADGNGVGQGGGEGTQLTSSEGATATVILPKLRRLRLDNLPQLKNICKAAMIYKSIEEIEIDDCPNLKTLPSFLSTNDGPPYLLPAGTFSSLRALRIFGCRNMKSLFTVQLLQSLQNLETLILEYCEGLEEIAADGNGVGQGGGEGTQLTSSEGATANVILPKLRRLRLDNLPQLKNICKATMICNSIEDIAIFNCPNLKRLPSFLSTIDRPPYLLPAGTFSSLKELSISKCYNMKQLFTLQLLQNLQNHEELVVKDCEGQEEIAADGNGVGQGGGEGTQLTSCEGATATVILPKLRRLRLNNLPQLKNICKAATIYKSIEVIAIFNCPNLKRLPSFLSTIDGPPYLLPAGTFSSFKELSISKCHNMKQLFTVQLLQNLQNLEELYVEDCEGLEEIAADGTGVGQGGGEGTQLTSSEGATATVILPKLRQLYLDNLPQLKNICMAAMICDPIKKIIIDDCPNLKRLPSFLSTIDGPPYLLPADTFSSLKGLSIFKCHNMKQLFTVQLLQNLQNLEELYVENCEGLEEIAADGNGVGQGGGEGTQLTSSERAIANVILPKLRWLSLTRLPQLKNICKAAMICNSIEEIEMLDCPKVKRLPLFLSTIGIPPSLPSTLHKIWGYKEWWESLEWDYPSAKKDLDPYFTTK